MSARDDFPKLDANTRGRATWGETSRQAQAALDEIDRLRAHARSLHKLNGHSKAKGWWCSCGVGIHPRYERGEEHPMYRRAEAEVHHAHHLDKVVG